MSRIVSEIRGRDRSSIKMDLMTQFHTFTHTYSPPRENSH